MASWPRVGTRAEYLCDDDLIEFENRFAKRDIDLSFLFRTVLYVVRLCS